MEYDNVQSNVEAVNSVLSIVFLTLDKTLHKVSDSNCSNFSKWKIDVFPWMVLHIIILTVLDIIPSSKRSSDLPTILYKNAAIFLSEPLSYLFKSSIENAEIPKCWKIAATSPIPKKSSPTPDDIRPISLLAFPSKILEMLTSSRIIEK